MVVGVLFGVLAICLLLTVPIAVSLGIATIAAGFSLNAVTGNQMLTMLAFKEMITEAIRALKSDTEWTELDLSKYFDTLNHEILMNLLRRNEKDERVVQLIKRYLKSGVMENGVVMEEV